MKITYEFTDDPESGDVETRALFEKSYEMMRALLDIDNLCRDVVKYEQDPHEERVKLAEEVRSIIAESSLDEVMW